LLPADGLTNTQIKLNGRTGTLPHADVLADAPASTPSLLFRKQKRKLQRYPQTNALGIPHSGYGHITNFSVFLGFCDFVTSAASLAITVKAIPY